MSGILLEGQEVGPGRVWAGFKLESDEGREGKQWYKQDLCVWAWGPPPGEILAEPSQERACPRAWLERGRPSILAPFLVLLGMKVV